MDCVRFKTHIVFQVYEGEEYVKEALGDYIEPNCSICFVRSDAEAFRHFKKEKYDFVLYDDCMVRGIPGVLGACFARSKRILIFVTDNYARWSFKKKWHSMIMWFNGTIATKIDCLYPSSVSILKKHFSRKSITSTPASLPKIEQYIQAGKRLKSVLVV